MLWSLWYRLREFGAAWFFCCLLLAGIFLGTGLLLGVIVLGCMAFESGHYWAAAGWWCLAFFCVTAFMAAADPS